MTVMSTAQILLSNPANQVTEMILQVALGIVVRAHRPGDKETAPGRISIYQHPAVLNHLEA